MVVLDSTEDGVLEHLEMLAGDKEVVLGVVADDFAFGQKVLNSFFQTAPLGQTGVELTFGYAHDSGVSRQGSDAPAEALIHKPGHDFGRKSSMRRGVEDYASAQGLPRRDAADNEPVAIGGHDLFTQTNARRLLSVHFVHHHGAKDLGRADMDPDSAAALGLDELYAGIDHLGGSEHAGRNKPRPPIELLLVDTLEIDGRPHSGQGLVHLPVVHL